MRGKRAVAKSGIASVIHQVAIKAATAAIRVRAGFPGSRSRRLITMNRTGPRARPIRCIRFFCFSLCGLCRSAKRSVPSEDFFQGQLRLGKQL